MAVEEQADRHCGRAEEEQRLRRGQIFGLLVVAMCCAVAITALFLGEAAVAATVMGTTIVSLAVTFVPGQLKPEYED